MSTSDCPTPAIWQALLGEDGADDTWLPHLERCPSCQQLVETLAAAPEQWTRTSRLLAATPFPVEERVQVQQVLQQLKRSLDGGSALGSDWQLPQGFLQRGARPELLGTIGHFEVHQVLGRGGMSVVFKAWDPELKRWVALKVLAPALACNAQARERFIREGQALAGLQHANIVAVHSVEAAAGLPYLVLSYVDGPSLQERLERAGPLAPRDIIALGVQIATGLHAAHQRGVIHRDIKPANVLIADCGLRIADSGQSAIVKITDFGLARVHDDGSGTRPGTVLGTPQFMAPEQARGEPLDTRADLYSLGALLYTLAAGRPPFQAESTFAVLKQVTEECPVPLRRLRPDFPIALEQVIMRLLAKGPAQRGRSAQEAAQALAAAGSAQTRPARQAPTRWLPTALVGSTLVAALAWWQLVVSPTMPNVDSVTTPATVARVEPAVQPALPKQQPTAPVSQRTTPQPPLAVAAPWNPAQPSQIGNPSSPPRGQALPLVGHTGPAVKVALSPDGRYAFSASGFFGDKTLRQWDYATGRELRQFTLELPYPATAIADFAGAEADQWQSIALSTDGSSAVTVSFGGLIVTWDVATGREKQRLLHKVRPTRGVFAPDGKTVLTGCVDGTLHLWDATSGALLKKWQGHTDRIRVLAYLPNGKTALSGGCDKTVKAWEVSTQKLLYTCDGHAIVVEGLTVARDGGFFLTGADDIRQWDAATGQLLRNFAIPRNAISSLALSPNQKLLASSGYDGSVRLWSMETAQELSKHQHLVGWAYDVAFSPDGQSVLSCGGGHNAASTKRTLEQCALQRWQFASTIAAPTQLAGHQGPVSALAVSADGKFVLSASGSPKGDRSVTLWDVATGKRLRQLQTDPALPFFGGADDEAGQYLALAVASSGLAFTGTSNGIGILWDVGSGQEIRRYQGHRGAIHAAVFAPDEKSIITASGDKSIRVWDVLTAQPLKKYTEHTAAVHSLALTRDGQRLLSASADGTVKVWDLKAEKYVQTLTAPNKAAQLRIVVTRDGKSAFSASEHVYQWDLVKGALLRTLEHPSKNATAVALAPEEQQLASADRSGRLYLWEVATGELLTGAAEHRDGVQELVFTPTGRFLLSAGGSTMGEKGTLVPGNDFAIRRWDLALILSR